MPPARLPLTKIIWGTFAFPALYPGAYVRAVGLPLLGVIGATIVSFVTQTSADAFVRGATYALYLLALCWLAIRTHRLVLLGSEEARPPTFAQARRSISAYLATMFVGWLAYVVGVFVVMQIILLAAFTRYVPAGDAPSAPAADADAQQTMDLIAFGASLPVLFLLARFILVLPAIALGQKVDLGAAWEQSRGNGWRLVVATLVLPRLFQYALEFLGTFAKHPAVIAMVVALMAIVASLQVVALSLAFRELAAARAPPPTDPPA